MDCLCQYGIVNVWKLWKSNEETDVAWKRELYVGKAFLNKRNGHAWEQKYIILDFPGGPLLPMQKTQVQSLVQGDSTCWRATKPSAPELLMTHARAHMPQLWSPHTETAETPAPRAHALQQEKPLQLERTPDRHN